MLSMQIPPFALERYFAKHEFTARYLLSSSDCDGLALQEVLELADRETKQLWDTLRLGYTESLGLPLLRQEVASLYTGITPEQVLILTPEEGIFLAMQAVLKPGDHIVCTFPGYQSLYDIAAAGGCEVTRWIPDEEAGWRFDPAELESLIRPNTRLIVMNFPHNPTGYLPPAADYTRMIECAKAHGIAVFSDEMYRYLEFDPADRLPSAAEVYDHAISLFGMSKTFGLAGVRIGWVITRDAELYRQMATLKDYTTICSAAPSEILSLIALRARERIIARHISRIQRNLGLLDTFFAGYGDLFTWTRPRAGTIGFPEFRMEGSVTTFCERLVNETGIMLLPSAVYGYDDRHVRLGLGRENLPEVLPRFTAYLDSTKPR